MTTHAQVTITLTDGRQIGTSDVTQGSVYETILEIMTRIFPERIAHRSVTISGTSPLLGQIVDVFKSKAELKFDAVVHDNWGEPGVITIDQDDFEDFKNRVLDGRLTLTAIEQDEHSSAFLPSWTHAVYDADFDDKRNLAIFLHYCELFTAGEILFGVQTKNISSIEFVVSDKEHSYTGGFYDGDEYYEMRISALTMKKAIEEFEEISAISGFSFVDVFEVDGVDIR